jgi:hypothetical protein
MNKEAKGFLESLGVLVPVLFAAWVMAGITAFIFIIKAVSKYILK